MNRMLIIQSYRRDGVPVWLGRCLASVEAWARSARFDYRLVGDESFALCGEEYLAQAGGNVRTITNLARLELIRSAHNEGYEAAAWIDADVLVFEPQLFRLDRPTRYAFARETWVEQHERAHWIAREAVNNSVFVCRAGEPDLDFLIAATRHIALRRKLRDNYQVGGDLIKGLRASLGFETLDDVGMLSPVMVLAVARNVAGLLQFQARVHGTPIHAANLCAGLHYPHPIAEAEALAAIDALKKSRGKILNRWLDGKGRALNPGEMAWVNSEAWDASLR